MNDVGVVFVPRKESDTPNQERASEDEGSHAGDTEGRRPERVVHEEARVRPFVAVWPRGHGKSSSAEMAVATLGVRGVRRFGLYVSGTQKQANDHLAPVQGMLEEAFPEFGVELTERRLGKYGQSKGWTQSRLRTNGFGLDAVGLDAAVRGLRDLEARPDFIVLDDIDAHDDSPLVTQGKVDTIARSILPAGGNDCVVLAVQNLVHPDGVFARLCGAEPPFLSDRVVSGPVPAVRGLVLDGDRIVGGEATWPAHKDIERCQRDITQWGLEAWLQEAQHEVGLRLREGLVLGADDDGVRILDPARNVRGRPATWGQCKWRILTIDPGGDGDATAIGAVGVTHDERHHVYWSKKLRGANDVLTWHDLIARWHERGAVDMVVVGETGGTVLVDTLRRMGWPARKAEMDRSMIQYLRGLLRTGRLTLEPDFAAGLLEEAESWWWKKVSEQHKSYVGQWQTITGPTHHADEWDAVRYAVASILRGLPGQPVAPVVQVGRGVAVGRIGRRKVRENPRISRRFQRWWRVGRRMLEDGDFAAGALSRVSAADWRVAVWRLGALVPAL